jgi:hypothetical protein
VSHQQHQQTHQQQQQIAGVDFCKFHTSKKNNIGLQEFNEKKIISFISS